MSRSARPIWISSLASVEGFPPTPDSMNEPQYVDLVWGSGCPFCGTTVGGTFSWLARVRYCTKCVRKRFSTCHGDLRRKALFLLNVFCEADLAQIMPYIDLVGKDGTTERLFSLDVAVTYNKEVYSDMSSDRIKRWKQDKEKAFAAVKQHAQLGEEWVARREADKREELNRRRDLRQQAIEKRLSDLGWAEEIAKLPAGALAKQKSVRTVAPLSDKGWLSIRDALVTFMQQQRDKRLADEKESALKARRNTLISVYPDFLCSKPFRAILPGVPDLETAPTVARLFRETPFDVEISASTFLSALAAIPPSFFTNWRARCEQELVARMQERMVENPVLRVALDIDTFTPDSLRLAILVLRGAGLKDLHYPRMFLSPYAQDHNYKAWDANDLYPDVEMILLARRAVELVGRDPRTTTVEDMEQLDPWYYYSDSAKDGRRTVFSWRYLLRQWILARGAQLELLGPEDTNIARHRLRTGSYYMSFFNDDAQCVHCAERFAASSVMKDHMREAHGIERTTRQDFHAGIYDYMDITLILSVKDCVPSAS
ncbi:hypothetical protein BD626DRAFT_85728 [Schizophyllum amplum]|uniref:C2H2-type domain-containing protein n=1 Tax=Schizophyllum amplum TaxID=97359 RepID=A0A550C9K6_9AGAR|nr:hypothetical protein BD626DRAFT_85728 [Auriculariopsis ampla]